MTTSNQANLFAEILKPENRADPHPLWEQMRRQPISRQDDGTWVVTGYEAVRTLMGDPRLSSDKTKAGPDATLRAPAVSSEGQFVGFIDMDPPDHERTRRAVMSHFGPPSQPRKVLELEPAIRRHVAEALDRPSSSKRMDVVDDFAYPVPLAIIMTLLGIPESDAETVKHWFEIITDGELQQPDVAPDRLHEFGGAVQDAIQYMMRLAAERRIAPGDDLLSGLAIDSTGAGSMPDINIAGTALLLLGAGHETTVNSVSSGILTLLRNPEKLQLVRDRPELLPGAFEEVLRLEPPIAFRDRHTLAEVTVGDITIPRGVTVQLSLVAANRDPTRFVEPNMFDPEREDNRHLSFLGGAHYCFGAPLARLEARIMLGEWLRRVDSPRLVMDPPPYRNSFGLRGPRHLIVDHGGIVA
jgi:cytochrome P450